LKYCVKGQIKRTGRPMPDIVRWNREWTGQWQFLCEARRFFPHKFRYRSIVIKKIVENCDKWRKLSN